MGHWRYYTTPKHPQTHTTAQALYKTPVLLEIHGIPLIPLDYNQL